MSVKYVPAVLNWVDDSIELVGHWEAQDESGRSRWFQITAVLDRDQCSSVVAKTIESRGRRCTLGGGAIVFQAVQVRACPKKEDIDKWERDYLREKFEEEV